MPSSKATGAECAAMKSLTIFDQASITSVSRWRSQGLPAEALADRGASYKGKQSRVSSRITCLTDFSGI
jgi:hypothetical protein